MPRNWQVFSVVTPLAAIWWSIFSHLRIYLSCDLRSHFDQNLKYCLNMSIINISLCSPNTGFLTTHLVKLSKFCLIGEMDHYLNYLPTKWFELKQTVELSKSSAVKHLMRQITRFTVHGRGAKHQHSNRMNNVILRIGLRKNTQDRKDCDFGTFPPGKITQPLTTLRLVSAVCVGETFELYCTFCAKRSIHPAVMKNWCSSFFFVRPI